MSDTPNVLFILTDDQGPWALRCAGNEDIRTPNLDRLAAEGMRFENFFCTSPVCSPARASIFTGRIPSQHGVHDWIRDKQEWYLPGRDRSGRPAAYLEALTCYTDILAANGYVCGFSGKWHLGDSLT
ncbi:MAG: sulfatase-like hydrolase/transferase, partial [Planctomycetota bacterium]